MIYNYFFISALFPLFRLGWIILAIKFLIAHHYHPKSADNRDYRGYAGPEEYQVHHPGKRLTKIEAMKAE